jgi:hypothetical protein
LRKTTKAGHSYRSAPVRVNCLIHINPQHPRHPRQHGSQRQKQNNSGDDTLCQRPVQNGPHQRREPCNHANTQAVADVHCAQKVSGLAFKFQPARRTPLVHSRKQPHRSAKDFPRTASRTKLLQNSSRRRHIRSLHGRSLAAKTRSDVEDAADLPNRPSHLNPACIDGDRPLNLHFNRCSHRQFHVWTMFEQRPRHTARDSG